MAEDAQSGSGAGAFAQDAQSGSGVGAFAQDAQSGSGTGTPAQEPENTQAKAAAGSPAEGLSEGMTVSGSFESGDFYIVGTAILPRRIDIYRVSREGSTYVQAPVGHIFLNDEDEKTSAGGMRVLSQDGFLRVCEARTGTSGEEIVLSSQRIRIRDNGESRRLSIDRSREQELYYAYGRGGLTGLYAEPSDAIHAVFEQMGCVTDSSARYIWQRSTRDLKKYLALNTTAAGSGSTLHQALRLFLTYEGVRASVIDAATEEDGVVAYLQGILTDRKVLNLHRCTLSEVLYFLNLGHPVLAVTGDDSAVLIIGYDSTNVTIYDPGRVVSGQEESQPEYTISQTEAAALFEGGDNQFVSCIDR